MHAYGKQVARRAEDSMCSGRIVIWNCQPAVDNCEVYTTRIARCLSLLNNGICVVCLRLCSYLFLQSVIVVNTTVLTLAASCCSLEATKTDSWKRSRDAMRERIILLLFRIVFKSPMSLICPVACFYLFF